MYASRFTFVFGLILIAVLSLAAQSASLWEKPVERCWAIKTDSTSSFFLASDNAHNLFFTKTSSSISSVQVLTGTLNWSVETSGLPVEGPVSGGSVVLAFSITGTPENGQELNVFSIDTSTGISRLLEKISLPRDFRVDSGSGFAVATLSDGRLGLIDSEGGVRALSSGVNELSGFSVVNSAMLVWSKTNSARIFDMPSAVSFAEFQLPAVTSGSFAFDSDRIYVGMSDGSLFAVRRDGVSESWTSRTGGAIEDVVRISAGILVSSRDNFVYLLSPETGNRKWKRKLAGRIIGEALLDDEHAAFLTFGSNDVFVLRLSDGKLVNAVRVKEAEYFVSGPLFSAGLLIVPHNAGITAFGPEGTCKHEKGS